MALTGRRELFAHEYLKDLNATQAAIRAGYAQSGAAVEGHRLLADGEVQALIAKLAAKRNEELGISARDVLVEMLRLLNSDLALAVNEDGTVKAIHDIPLDVRRAIASVKVQETFEGAGKDRVWTGYIKEIKFWNKEKAIEMLARHLSLFNDKLPEGTSDLVRAILDARRNAGS